MSERPRLDAVIFDAGGTLVRLDFEWMSGELGRLGLEIGAESLRRAEVSGRRRYDASRRPIIPDEIAPLGASGDTRAYFGGMLEAAGVGQTLLEHALDRFWARHLEAGLWTRPVEGAREAIDALGAMGLRRAVVSNSDGRAESHLIDCDMLRGLEFVVDSHLVGFEKPDPRIFRVALDRMGVPSRSALYVGDIRSVDEVGARAANMHFVLIDPYGDYASAETPSIEQVRRLPEWIRTRFDLEPRRDHEPLRR